MFISKIFILKEFSAYLREKSTIIFEKKTLCRQGILSDFIIYRDFNLTTDYSGGIIIGRGFLKEYYYVLGKQSPLAFDIVYELTIESGKIIKTIDKSEEIKKYKRKYKNLILLYVRMS